MPSPRAWWEGSWGVGRVPQVQPPAEFPPAIPALPCGCLDSWSQECRGLLVGEVNWKQENMAFLSSRPGLGKQLRGCLFPSPAPQGKRGGGMVILPCSLLGLPPYQAPSLLEATVGYLNYITAAAIRMRCSPLIYCLYLSLSPLFEGRGPA